MVCGYEISTDPARMDIERIHGWLSGGTWWAAGRPRDVVERTVATSLSFGVFPIAEPGRQVAYARVVTDLATFARICDVFVDPDHRGLGLGVWLTASIRARLGPFRLKRITMSAAGVNAHYAHAGPSPRRTLVAKAM